MNEIKSSEQFEQNILNSINTAFADFWAEWCGPCKIVSPVVYDLSKEYDVQVNFVKVNVDQRNDLAQKYNVYSVPAIAIFKDGTIIAQQEGATTKESFKTMIDGSMN